MVLSIWRRVYVCVCVFIIFFFQENPCTKKKILTFHITFHINAMFSGLISKNSPKLFTIKEGFLKNIHFSIKTSTILLMRFYLAGSLIMRLLFYHFLQICLQLDFFCYKKDSFKKFVIKLKNVIINRKNSHHFK